MLSVAATGAVVVGSQWFGMGDLTSLLPTSKRAWVVAFCYLTFAQAAQLAAALGFKVGHGVAAATTTPTTIGSATTTASPNCTAFSSRFVSIILGLGRDCRCRDSSCQHRNCVCLHDGCHSTWRSCGLVCRCASSHLLAFFLSFCTHYCRINRLLPGSVICGDSGCRSQVVLSSSPALALWCCSAAGPSKTAQKRLTMILQLKAQPQNSNQNVRN